MPSTSDQVVRRAKRRTGGTGRVAGGEPRRALRAVLAARPRSGSSSRAPGSPRLAVRCPAGAAADERATSVPVTVWDPPAWVETLDAGDVVVVVGRMRRRFYQRPGGVGSRVDVEAELSAGPATDAGSTPRCAGPTTRSRRSGDLRDDLGAVRCERGRLHPRGAGAPSVRSNPHSNSNPIPA